MKAIPSDDLLDVLACEIQARPEAPTVSELAPLVRNLSRREGALVVEFPAEARPVVEAFAAAERLCCAGIDWEVAAGPLVTLRIAANAAALDVLEEMWKTSI